MRKFERLAEMMVDAHLSAQKPELYLRGGGYEVKNHYEWGVRALSLRYARSSMKMSVGNPTTEAMMNTVREYDARVDTKKRVTLRGTEYRNYHVREYADGRIEMLPQELVEVSARTVEMMDRSIENLDTGVAGEPLDLSRFRD